MYLGQKISLGSINLESDEKAEPLLTLGNPLPRSLESQYNGICAAILQTGFMKEIASIISLYALSVGYQTDFRRHHFTYTCFNGDKYTAVTYNAGAPDFQNALLDFSFRGSCVIRFRIHKKSDEMWLGVVGDLDDLEERSSSARAVKGQWAFYCGRTRIRYYGKRRTDWISREKILASFKPELNIPGVIDGGYGSFHFPGKYLHRLVPCNTGDVVDLAVDAQSKMITVVVNGVFQASSIAPDLPDQLAFFVQLDDAEDCVEFEVLDFKFEKRRKLKDGRNAKVVKFVD